MEWRAIDLWATTMRRVNATAHRVNVHLSFDSSGAAPVHSALTQAILHATTAHMHAGLLLIH